MIVNITGTNEAIKDLEKARKLINEARDILYRVPSAIRIEIDNDTKNEQTKEGEKR